MTPPIVAVGSGTRTEALAHVVAHAYAQLRPVAVFTTDAEGVDSSWRSEAEKYGVTLCATAKYCEKHGKKAVVVANGRVLNAARAFAEHVGGRVVVAFCDPCLPKSRGTRDMVERARRQNIETFNAYASWIDDSAYEVHLRVLHARGNLLKRSGCLAHQTNCLALKPCGLAERLEKALPYAATYQARRTVFGTENEDLVHARAHDRAFAWKMKATPLLPGEVEISFGPHDRPIVGTLLGQWECGEPGVCSRRPVPEGVEPNKDTCEARVAWLGEAFGNFARWARAHEICEINMPHKIGCGLAGGDWAQIEPTLARVAKEQGVVIVFFELE